MAGVFSGAEGIVSPLQLPGAKAWYDVSDLSSMRNDAGAIPSNGEGVKLISDKSGNSSVNVLCLNGVAGNNATAPSAAPLNITGDVDFRARIAADDWSRAAGRYAIAKYGAAGTRSYLFGITNGRIEVSWSADGTAIITKASTASPVVSNYGALWIRATIDVDNGAAGNDVTFYTSPDGITWTQLGATVTTAGTTSIFSGASVLTIGQFTGAASSLEGLIYRTQIYAGLTGSDLRFDANFATASKLATSFTESSSNAATVTINTSGATGARISGARDLYQGTAANQPILTIAAGGNYLTGDGSNDFLRSALYSQGQPVTRFTAGSQITWTSGDYLWDGASAANTGAIIQTTTTPQINMNAGSSVAANTDFTLDTRMIVTEVINGASSSLGINRLAEATGNAGAGTPNGVTIGASGASTAANFGKITFSERVEYSSAFGAAQKLALQLYMGRKWGVAV